MFHPGPATLSIYKQNPRNAPLYSTLFPLDLLGFRTKKLYSVTKTQIEQNRCAMACQGCGAVFYFF